jgi:glucokinase
MDMDSAAPVLAGDIGGTNVRLALFRPAGALAPGAPRPESLEILPCRNYPSLSEALRDYIGRRRERPVRACLGVAGVILGGRVEMVNLGWSAGEDEIAAEFGLREMAFMNDLEANAHGLEALGPEDFGELAVGDPDPAGNRGLVSAGTGLGEAGMIRTSLGYLPFHSEGGHSDFAPRDEEGIALLRWLAERHGRVSWERVLSGPGLANIHAFLRDSGREREPAWLGARMREEDPARVITEAGMAGEADICVRALDMFASAYGAEAGNVALKLLATGGIFLGGGIAPKILPKLQEGAFLRSFRDKGRLSPLLERIPVKVVLEDKAALLGAARVALGTARRRLSAVSLPA